MFLSLNPKERKPMMTTTQQDGTKRESESTYSGRGNGYSFTKEMDLGISPIETSKDMIEQPDLAKHDNMYIPPLGSSVIISGKSGSGKSTLLANLLMDPRFYGPSERKPKGWFEKIFLFSPTANGDDVQKSLNIPKQYVFTDLEEAPELLEVILNTQQEKLDNGSGAHKVAQFCIIFDDVIGDTKFMNDREFTRCFYQVRHVNCTTFICTQHFRRVPKVCRLQANFVFFFQGSSAEVDIVTEEYAPPMYTKNEFKQLVNDASSKKHTFLTINNKIGWDKRFRRNLDEIINLERFQQETEEKEDIENKNGSEGGRNRKRKKNEQTSNSGEYEEEDEWITTAIKGRAGYHGPTEQTSWRSY
jgi:hypothetical protein